MMDLSILVFFQRWLIASGKGLNSHRMSDDHLAGAP